MPYQQIHKSPIQNQTPYHLITNLINFPAPTSLPLSLDSIISPMDIPQLYDSLVPTFTVWFITIYIIGYSIAFKKWDKKHRGEASSCLMSLFHGNLALLLSIVSLIPHESHKLQLSSPNTPFQNSVLDHSIAYFTTDLLHYIFSAPTGAALFIVHHLATLYVLLTCRYLFGHGAVPVLGVLAIAEATSTCQNTWSLAGYRRRDSARAAAVVERLSPVFYGYYSVVRGIVGPLFVYKINGLYFLNWEMEMEGYGVIPKWGWVSWMVVMAVGIGLSVFWVVFLWVDLYKHRVNNKYKDNGVKKLS